MNLEATHQQVVHQHPLVGFYANDTVLWHRTQPRQHPFQLLKACCRMFHRKLGGHPTRTELPNAYQVALICPIDSDTVCHHGFLSFQEPYANCVLPAFLSGRSRRCSFLTDANTSSTVWKGLSNGGCSSAVYTWPSSGVAVTWG